MPRETFEQKCQRLEHWETDGWATPAVLKKELLTSLVIDPCTGTGIMGRAAEDEGYEVLYADIQDWGHNPTLIHDWLNPTEYIQGMVQGATVLMNPPFTKSEAFVDMARQMGARKIVCFQRFDWYEGSDTKGKQRGAWWGQNRPARIWVCGDRANCHLHSYPEKLRKQKGSRKQTYAFFVWEQGHTPAAITGHIYKSDLQAAETLTLQSHKL